MKKTILVKFGKKIREVRTKRGLSQEALADMRVFVKSELRKERVKE